MNEILDPPAERDLPRRTAYTMRARLLHAVEQRPARPGRLRIAVAALVLSITTAGVATGMWDRPDQPTPPDGSAVRLVAMGFTEASQPLRDVAQQCLSMHPGARGTDPVRGGPPFRLTIDDLAVGIDADGRALVLFMNNIGYRTCDLRDSEVTGTPEDVVKSIAVADDRWQAEEWLPGPVQRLLLVTTEFDGGQVAVSGRVGSRVARLVLDHGDGRTTPARIAEGAFGLLTGAPVKAADDPELIGYDATGKEIGRLPLFQAEDQLTDCYVTPAGKVVYGNPSDNCRPAEKWRP